MKIVRNGWASISVYSYKLSKIVKLLYDYDIFIVCLIIFSIYPDGTDTNESSKLANSYMSYCKVFI